MSVRKPFFVASLLFSGIIGVASVSSCTDDDFSRYPASALTHLPIGSWLHKVNFRPYDAKARESANPVLSKNDAYAVIYTVPEVVQSLNSSTASAYFRLEFDHPTVDDPYYQFDLTEVSPETKRVKTIDIFRVHAMTGEITALNMKSKKAKQWVDISAWRKLNKKGK